jgi:hypothetical protein
MYVCSTTVVLLLYTSTRTTRCTGGTHTYHYVTYTVVLCTCCSNPHTSKSQRSRPIHVKLRGSCVTTSLFPMFPSCVFLGASCHCAIESLHSHVQIKHNIEVLSFFYFEQPQPLRCNLHVSNSFFHFLTPTYPLQRRPLSA